MLARAAEAYIADRMIQNGTDPRGVAKSDDAYTNTAIRELIERYPQQHERDAIFNAMAGVFDALHRASMFGIGAGLKSTDVALAAPHTWGRTNSSEGRRSFPKWIHDVIAQEGRAARGLFGKGHEPLFTDPSRPPNRLSRMQRINELPSNFMLSPAQNLQRVINRIKDPVGKNAIQKIKDMITPRTGEGGHTYGSFEERVRARLSVLSDLYRAMEQHGLLKMTEIQGKMLDHVLATGDDTFPAYSYDLSPSGVRWPIPDNIKALHGKVRYLLNREYDYQDEAKVPLGYARARATSRASTTTARFSAMNPDFYAPPSGCTSSSWTRTSGRPATTRTSWWRGGAPRTAPCASPTTSAPS